MPKAYVSKAQTDWDLFAGYVTKAYNAAYHPTLLTSPYQLLFGRVPLSRIESVDVAKDDSVPKAMCYSFATNNCLCGGCCEEAL